MKPVYAERILLDKHKTEVTTRNARGEKVKMGLEDIERQFTHTRLVKLMERDLTNKFNSNPKQLPKKYHRLIKAQKGVIAHVKQCYKICHEEAKGQSKKRKDYHLLLKKNGECEFPSMSPLESFKELESDNDDLFRKD